MLPMLQMADRERLKVGSSKGRVRTADEQGEYLTPDYRVLKVEPAPSTPPANRLSRLLPMTLSFQEPAADLTPVRTGVEGRIIVNAVVTMFVARLRTTNDGRMSIPGLSGGIK